MRHLLELFTEHIEEIKAVVDLMRLLKEVGLFKQMKKAVNASRKWVKRVLKMK